MPERASGEGFSPDAIDRDNKRETPTLAAKSNGRRVKSPNWHLQRLGESIPYVMPCWKNVLNNTTFTVGVNRREAE